MIEVKQHHIEWARERLAQEWASGGFRTIAVSYSNGTWDECFDTCALAKIAAEFNLVPEPVEPWRVAYREWAKIKYDKRNHPDIDAGVFDVSAEARDFKAGYEAGKAAK